MVLPSETSAVRAPFVLLLDTAGERLQVVAEVDDMAMMRLLAAGAWDTTARLRGRRSPGRADPG